MKRWPELNEMVRQLKEAQSNVENLLSNHFKIIGLKESFGNFEKLLRMASQTEDHGKVSPEEKLYLAAILDDVGQTTLHKWDKSKSIKFCLSLFLNWFKWICVTVGSQNN